MDKYTLSSLYKSGILCNFVAQDFIDLFISWLKGKETEKIIIIIR